MNPIALFCVTDVRDHVWCVLTCIAGLGMSVIAYDPALSMEAAWRLPGQLINRTLRLEELLNDSDYITLHVPYARSLHPLPRPLV